MDLSVLKKTAQLRAFGPGRINLIGEHTDYNQGYVLPAAIEQGLRVHLRQTGGHLARIQSAGHPGILEIDLHKLSRSGSNYQNYFLGLLNGLERRSQGLSGFEAYLEGDLPAGAGVSSSAALECCLLLGLNRLFKLGLEKSVLLEIARETDHEFVGVKSGIMDQYASLYGEAGHFLMLDCRSGTHQAIPQGNGPYQWLLLNSGITHEHADGAYNQRQESCRAGVALLREEFPAVRSLRDAGERELRFLEDRADPVIAARCRYVVEENARVLSAADALAGSDWQRLGQLMYHTHEGLSRQYEVSCPEIDYLVALARSNPAVVGARLMGGGFGGCTLNLVHREATAGFIEACRTAYQDVYGLELSSMVVSPSAGARILT